jgi:YVTN family beta-propeller protein
MIMQVRRCKRGLLLLVPLLVAGMIVACDLGGLIGGRETVPSVVINAPLNNSEVRLGEVVSVRSVATDDTGVTRVELWVDDALLASELSPAAQGQAHFSVAQNWTPQALGSHRILARAYNAAGNMGESPPITLIVTGEPPGPQPTLPGPQATEPGPPPTQPPPQGTPPGPPPTQAPPPTQPPPQPTQPPPATQPPGPPTPTPITGPCLPTVVDTIGLVGHPKGVAAHGQRVYVGLYDQPLVQVIDANTNTVLPASLNTHASTGPGYCNGVAYHNGRVYVANRDAGTVSSVNVSNPGDWNEITVGSLPFGVAAAGQRVYVANFGSNTVSIIDPSSDTVSTSCVDMPGVGLREPSLLAPLGQNVFVPTHGMGPVLQIGPSCNPTAVSSDKEGYFAVAANTDSGRIFVTDRDGGNVLRINASTGNLEGSVHVPHRPYGIAVNTSKKRVYVVAPEANLLYVVDGPSMQIVGSVSVGGQGATEGGQGIAVLGNKVYVSNHQAGSVTVLDDSVCP